MRLSTASDRDEDGAMAALHAAFDTGVNFLDTADAYCLDEGEAGHNERLIARAIASWRGDRSTLRVATREGSPGRQKRGSRMAGRATSKRPARRVVTPSASSA